MSKIANINAYLQECGKTGADLAKAIGLSNSVYSQWNTGKNDVSNRNLPKIAAYFTSQLGRTITVSDLLAEHPTAEPPAQSREQRAMQLFREISDPDQEHLISLMESLRKK